MKFKGFLGIFLFLCCGFLSAGAAAQFKPDPRAVEMAEYEKKYGYLYEDNSPAYAVNPYNVRGAPGMGDYYVRNAQPLNEELTFSKLVETIKKKKLTTIESVIESLPYEMLNRNYVLMYRSRSLQESTPEAPRAIVYTPTASFVLSFNGGNPGTRGAQTIEAIQFDHQTNRFEFRELTFDNQNLPKISEPNPAKCLECHQSPSRKGIDMRPNWEPYSVWIGAYGSAGGAFNRLPLSQTMLTRNQGHGLLPQDDEALAEQANEFEFFKNYINNVAPKHPRYSKLGQFNLHASVDLAEHFMVWGLKRVMRLITEDTEINSRYRDILAWSMNCSVAKKEVDASAGLQWHLQFKYPQYYDFANAKYPGAFNNVSQKLTFLYEPLGVDTSDWSLDFGTGGRFAFYERFGTPSNTEAIFKYVWAVFQMRNQTPNSINCDEIKPKALKQLDVLLNSGEMQRIRQSRMPAKPEASQILSRCVSCHSAEDRQSRIPLITFDQPSTLGVALKQPATTHPTRTLLEEIEYRAGDMATQKEQMPPSHRLSLVERNVLINYLKEFVK